MSDHEQVCRCGRPSGDRYFCETCADQLSVALGEVPWVDEELETSVTRAKGVDYRTLGGTRGSERPSPVQWGASEARRDLRGVLIAWAKFCHDHDIRNSAPNQALPPGDLPTPTALSRYLLWRIDGLALDPLAAAVIDQITTALNRCKRVVDRAADKLYAGKCGYETPDATCTNELYVKVGAKVVKCQVCGTEWDVPERRAWLLSEAEEVLATATEISRAVSWLGEQPLTADRVRQWASRDRITARGHDRDERPLYRVGDAIDLLANGSTKKATA